MASRRTPKDGLAINQSYPKARIAGGIANVVRTSDDTAEVSLVSMLVPYSDASQVRDAIVHRSIPGSRLRQLRNELHLSIDAIAQLLDIAPRTVNRKEMKEQPLSVAEGDRAFRIARIGDLAIELIGDRQKALAWLNRPNAYLGGKKPLEMLDTEIGADIVAQSLHTIAYGGTA